MMRFILFLAGFISLSERAYAVSCLPDSEFTQHQKRLNSYVHVIPRDDGTNVSLYLFEDSSDPLGTFEKFLEVIRKDDDCLLSVSFLNRQQLDERYEIFASWTELVEGASGDNEGMAEGEGEELAEADIYRYTSLDHFRVPDVYTGPIRRPDFKGRDKDFATFRTSILEGMKKGANFNSEYTVTQIGCGSNCSIVILSNLRTGEQFRFPRGGEEVGPLSLLHSANSGLLISTSTTGFDGECFLESFLFNGEWVSLLKASVGPADLCYDDVETNISRYKSKSGAVTEQIELAPENSMNTQTAQMNAGNSEVVTQLKDAYGMYMLVRGCYEAREGQALVYLNSTQMEQAKKAVREIERRLTEGRPDVDTDKIWAEVGEATAADVRMLKSPAVRYNDELKSICAMTAASLVSKSGSQTTVPEKDF